MLNLSSKPKTALLVVFVIAAFARVSLTDTSAFLEEQAEFYLKIYQTAMGEERPLLGTPVSNLSANHPGPAFYYLLALSQWFSATPEAAYVWVALLGALGVWLVALGMSYEFGLGAGVFAGVLMACSPWSIFYADSVWNSDVIAFWIALSFWATMKLRQKPDSWAVSIFLLSAAILPQFHLSAPIIWVPLGILAGNSLRRWNKRWVALGVLFVFLAYFPYLVSEFQSGFANTKALLSGGEGRGLSGARGTALSMVPLFLYRFLTLDTVYFELAKNPTVLQSFHHSFVDAFTGTSVRPFNLFRFAALLSSITMAVSSIFVWIKYRARASHRVFLVALGAAVATNVALLVLQGRQVPAHYVQPLLPFLFVGFAVLWNWSDSSSRLRKCLVVGATLFCLGGIESTQTLSHEGAASGLAVHRYVVETIYKDRKTEGVSSTETSSIDFKFPASLHSYQVFLDTQFFPSFEFDSSAKSSRYTLEDARYSGGATDPRGFVKLTRN